MNDLLHGTLFRKQGPLCGVYARYEVQEMRDLQATGVLVLRFPQPVRCAIAYLPEQERILKAIKGQ